jgi:hypothetical protein
MNSQMVSWMKSNENLQVLGEERRLEMARACLVPPSDWHTLHVRFMCSLQALLWDSNRIGPFRVKLPYYPLQGVLFFSLSFSRAPFSSFFFKKKCWFLQFCIKYFTLWYFFVFVFDKYFHNCLCLKKKLYEN